MKPKKLLVFAYRVAVAAAFALVATLPLAAQDRDQDWHQLRGTYFITGDNSCVVSSTGFKPNLTPAAAAVVYSQSASVQGIVKFHADGTGTGQLSELFITLPPATTPGASSDDDTFPFTYTVADDGVLTFTPGSVSGTFTAGPFKGLTLSDTPPPLSGRIARERTAITLTSTVPTAETVTIYFPPPPTSIGTFEFTRICYRTRVLIPVHGDEED